MEIAYTQMLRTSEGWVELCVWLDTNCPGWKLAHHHSKMIQTIRDGSLRLGLVAIPRLIKTTKEHAAIIKLFHDDAKIIWSGEALSAEVCMAACELSEYSGENWREMPVELLSESTIRMVKEKLAGKDE